MRVRLAGEGAGGRKALLEGLAGATLTAEALRLAVEALSVQAGAGAVLRLDTRMLRGEETLSEAGLGERDEVEVWVGEGGGMLGALDALQRQTSGFVSVLDLAGQQGQAAVSPVYPVTTPVRILIADSPIGWFHNLNKADKTVFGSVLAE